MMWATNPIVAWVLCVIGILLVLLVLISIPLILIDTFKKPPKAPKG